MTKPNWTWGSGVIATWLPKGERGRRSDLGALAYAINALALQRPHALFPGFASCKEAFLKASWRIPPLHRIQSLDRGVHGRLRSHQARWEGKRFSS